METMGLLSGIIKTAINVATIPLSAVGDVIDSVTEENQFKKSKTEKNLERLGNSIEDTFDGGIL